DGQFARMREEVLRVSDCKNFEKRKAASLKNAKLRGRGLACYLEWTGAPIRTETVDIQIESDGTVTVFTGTQAMGQGLETTYSQLVGELLGLPLENIKIVQGDTDLATGVGSVGSRSAFVGGSAAVAAGRRAIARGKELAAEALETAPGDIEYRDGARRIARTDRATGLAELAARPPENGVPR